MEPDVNFKRSNIKNKSAILKQENRMLKIFLNDKDDCCDFTILTSKNH